MFDPQDFLKSLESDPVFKARFLNIIGDDLVKKMDVDHDSNMICDFESNKHSDINFKGYSESDFEDIYFEVAEPIIRGYISDIIRNNPNIFRGKENRAISDNSVIAFRHQVHALMKKDFEKYDSDFSTKTPVSHIAIQFSLRVAKDFNSAIYSLTLEEFVNDILKNIKS